FYLDVFIRPSVRCAQVIELPAAPISQIVWDRTTTNVLLAVSPNSNKIMVSKHDSTQVKTTNSRVYDRSTWREERWSGLAGRAVSAVWSPSGDSLVFSSEDSYQIYAISFVAKNEINEDGISEARWTGDTCAVPIFDVSPVEFDPSELEVDGAVEREIVTIGGKIHNLTLSPDGQRLAVSFKGIFYLIDYCLLIVTMGRILFFSSDSNHLSCKRRHPVAPKHIGSTS
ncbi:hypothetical protein OSTOST_21683, partial [Ostertagia ostertagi]